jgi:hypothetical protein
LNKYSATHPAFICHSCNRLVIAQRCDDREMKPLLSEGAVVSDRPNETPDLRRYPVPMLWTALGSFAVALVVRLVAGVVPPLHPDEPWHLLAAHSWLQDGTLRIDIGAYTRTDLLTILVAWFMGLFGETFAAGRFPSSIAGAALIAAVFAWTYRQSGRLAAWFAAGLFCFLELAVEVSALMRFSAPQALLLWIGSAVLYQLTGTAAFRQRSMIGLGFAVFCLAGALYLQRTTAVALVPLGLWLACDLVYRSGLWRRFHRRQIMMGSALAVVIVLAIGLLSSLPLFSELISTYREVRIWNEANSNNVLFYHRDFMRDAPLLWALSPVATILAWGHRGRAASFCAAMWFASIVLLSFGGVKADRYIFFAVPYLCALWGLAVASIASLIGSNVRTGWLSSEPASASRAGSRTLTVALFISFVLAVTSQTSFLATAYLYQEIPSRGGSSATSTANGAWDRALGEQSGAPADRSIGTARSPQQFIARFHSGPALIDSPAWRQRGGIDEETAEVLMASAKLTEFKASSGSLLAFEWADGSEAGSAECDRIRKTVTGSSRIDLEAS